MRTGIVIVTYNRLKDLKGTLEAYEKQSLSPAFMVVIDNHSSDGTDAFLAEWSAQQGKFERNYKTLSENRGGSGGFYAGMEWALEKDCDWIFVADDDAVPDEHMLEELEKFTITHPELAGECAAICTAVLNKDHYEGIHRCRIKKNIWGYLEPFVPETEYTKDYFELNIYSFVGSMIRKEALLKAGTAREDFFIYYDDYEHAMRVNKEGKIVCVTSSVMRHIDNFANNKEASWRDYYATRNAVYTHLIHYGKFYAKMRAFRRMLVAYASFNPQKVKVVRQAVRDAYKEKLGKHALYAPGWTPGK